jgi:hypothetical protein
LIKILYSSIDEHGNSNKGFIEAANNHEALNLLTDKGHSQVHFYGDGTLSIESDQELLAPFDDKSASFQIEIRHRRDFVPILVQSLYINKGSILLGMMMLIGGWYFESSVVMYSGIGLSVCIPLYTAWKHRATRRYDQLLANYAVGNWQWVLKDVAFLRKHQAGLEMAFDFDIREAVAYFKLDGDTKAIEALDEWREVFEEEVPGYFESRMASVQHGLGYPEKFIELMREAFFKSSMSPAIITDLTLGEARLGDVDKAEKLLNTIPTEELPIEGQAFVDWIAGLTAYRSGGSGAIEFESALRRFSEFAGNPALWPSIAVCVGDWAIHASQTEWREFDIAEKVRAVWAVLEVQSEAETVKRISERLSQADIG